jgi:subtilisin family serine protease/predicted  nucleic acid-binding Zn-ribbon protein
MLTLNPAIGIITSAASNNDFNALRNFSGHGWSYLVNGGDRRFIAFSKHGDVESLKSFVESVGGMVLNEYRVLKGVAFEGSKAVADALKRRGFDVYEDRVYYLVEPLQLPTVNVSPMLLRGVGVKTVGADKLAALGVNGSGIRVAVIDTGVENLHPWLVKKNNVSVVAWEVDATGTGVVDYCGKRLLERGIFVLGAIHGTHVAGIIASQNATAPGVAPGASLYDVIVFPEFLDGVFTNCTFTYASLVVAGVEQALLGPDGKPGTGDEADVLSLSLGAVAPPEIQYAIATGIVKDPLVEALERAVEMGKVVVVAAGNAYGLNKINVLCLAKGVICVGASSHMGTPDPADDMLAWFSSKGPGPLGYMLPHVVAPGVYVFSSIPTAMAKLLNFTVPGARLSGTSMSTPFVSASAALLLSYFKSMNTTVEPRKIMTRLTETAGDVRPQSIDAFWLLPPIIKELYRWYIPTPPVNTPVDQGGGLINVFNAASAEVELYISDEPLGYLVMFKEPLTFNITIRSVVNKTVSVAISRANVKLWNIYTFEDVSNRVEVPSLVLEVGPGGEAHVSVSVRKLDPGVYGGYISFTVTESGRKYRIPILIVVPVSVGGEDLRVVQPLKLAIGTRDVLDAVTVYIYAEKPLHEPLTLAALSAPGAPGMVTTTITTPSGFFTSYTNAFGYVLLEPGFYTITSYILAGYALPLNTSFTLVVGVPILTDKVVYALETLQQLSARVSLIESSLKSIEVSLNALNTSIKILEESIGSVKIELQARTQLLEGRISSLNQTIIELGKSLRNLEEVLSKTRSELVNVREGLAAVNTTLSRRIVEESQRLEQQINSLNTRLQQARSELEMLRTELAIKVNALNKTITNVNMTLSQRVAEESKKLGEQISTLNTKLQQAKEELGTAITEVNRTLSYNLAKNIMSVRQELSNTSRELSTRIEELGGEHAATRSLTIATLVIALVGIGLGGYSIAKAKAK